jgi:ABC-type transporter Mla subunit MlaD
VIEDFIRDSDTVITQLEAKKEEVSRWIVETGETAEISATRREDLARTFNRLPSFLDELRPTMARLEGLADEQIPLLRDARAAAPSLDEFLTRLGPFAEASRPAVRSLGKTSEQGTKAFQEGADEVEDLRRLARDVPPTAKPLRQFLESLDDDRRAVDEDPRALVGGPPASDESNRNGGKGGFTGLEALWNFFFWSGMSINGFDDVSHLLRVSVTESRDCTPYQNNVPSKDPSVAPKIEKCNQWLGPNQPGINAPDFTQGSQAAALARAARRPAARVGERRAPGQPDAGPVPGQRDISKPQITLAPRAGARQG